MRGEVCCLQHMEAWFGSREQEIEAKVPGRDGWSTIPLYDLRAMQDNMIVLHSSILEEETNQSIEHQKESFWRGCPPIWHDFHANVDIKRQVYPDLMERLREALEENQNYTVKFYHRAGTGGTTAALRAAWDLRTEYPTAILTYWSPAIESIESVLYLACLLLHVCPSILSLVL